jgi:hypothetical protein
MSLETETLESLKDGFVFACVPSNLAREILSCLGGTIFFYGCLGDNVICIFSPGKWPPKAGDDPAASKPVHGQVAVKLMEMADLPGRMKQALDLVETHGGWPSEDHEHQRTNPA